MLFPRIPTQPVGTSLWGLILIAAYSFFLRPTLFFFWPDLRPGAMLVLASAVALCLSGIFIWKKKIALGSALKRSHLGPHILLGLSVGCLVVLSPLFLDYLIEKSSLAKEPLFIGAETRSLEQPPLTWLTFLELLVLRPLLGQILLIGVCMQTLAGRVSQMSFILMTACLFPVFFWEFSLGSALVGAVSAGMFCLTGTLYAGLGFHALCGLGGCLTVYVVPRTLTLFGILL